MVNFINRKSYAAMYGPSVGDKIRLEKLHDNFMIVELYKRKK